MTLKQQNEYVSTIQTTVDWAARAMLTHRNTPVQDLDMSPAVMLNSRIIKDHLSV